MRITIQRATIQEVKPLGLLFDKYRMFYSKKTDIAGAEHYLTERLSNNECVIFDALVDNEYVGFIQLYPSFSSIGMRRIWILNDLYVEEQYRKQGIATALIHTAINYARETGRSKIILSTAYDNHTAQALYERIGFVKEAFHEYEYIVK